MSNNIALIVIYNHRFDKNIEIIEKIYRHRFSNIYHLVPFYTGNKENVIAVYENSHYFQGYIAQGFTSFYKPQYEHYFFVADDMIINPIITQHNYKDIFRLTDKTGFIPELFSLPAVAWAHNREAILYNPYRKGIEVKNELPSVEEAKDAIAKYHVKNEAFTFKEVYFPHRKYYPGHILQAIVTYCYDSCVIKASLKKMRYPLALAYSDILIVSSASIHKFIHYCGVFAATGLWVELAIPTALILSGETIITEQHTSLKGKPLWEKEVETELAPYQFNLKKLLDEFPPAYIYLHPIKLSKWNHDSV